MFHEWELSSKSQPPWGTLKNQEEQAIGRQAVAEFALPRPDGVEGDMVIVELKSVRGLVVAHEIQLVNCLLATAKPVGLILNFGKRKVEVKRKVNDLSQG